MFGLDNVENMTEQARRCCGLFTVFTLVRTIRRLVVDVLGSERSGGDCQRSGAQGRVIAIFNHDVTEAYVSLPSHIALSGQAGPCILVLADCSYVQTCILPVCTSRGNRTDGSDHSTVVILVLRCDSWTTSLDNRSACVQNVLRWYDNWVTSSDSYPACTVQTPQLLVWVFSCAIAESHHLTCDSWVTSPNSGSACDNNSKIAGSHHLTVGLLVMNSSRGSVIAGSHHLTVVGQLVMYSSRGSVIAGSHHLTLVMNSSRGSVIAGSHHLTGSRLCYNESHHLTVGLLVTNSSRGSVIAGSHHLTCDSWVTSLNSVSACAITESHHLTVGLLVMYSSRGSVVAGSHHLTVGLLVMNSSRGSVVAESNHLTVVKSPNSGSACDVHHLTVVKSPNSGSACAIAESNHLTVGLLWVCLCCCYDNRLSELLEPASDSIRRMMILQSVQADRNFFAIETVDCWVHVRTSDGHMYCTVVPGAVANLNISKCSRDISYSIPNLSNSSIYKRQSWHFCWFVDSAYLPAVIAMGRDAETADSGPLTIVEMAGGLLECRSRCDAHRLDPEPRGRRPSQGKPESALPFLRVSRN
ncbi:hypothetical protein J6590_030580 [Homalodisca vitripennis]|nr:hypothetical protein J6590_030580 [Homalodisca vitripennis]